LKTNMGHI